MTRTTSPHIVWEVTDDHAYGGVQLPKIIGFDSSGKAIWHASGGAAITIDDWIPIEYDDQVVRRVLRESVIEGRAQRYIMGSKTKSIPRSAGVTVAAGTTYTDDASTNDEITLTARRFIARVKIDEDDLADASTRMDVIGTKALDWAISYADVFDNACLAVTGAENGTTVPFTSMYRRLRSTNTDTSYTADANYLTWDDDLTSIAAPAVGTSLYEKLSALFALVERGKYWSQADELVIAHPGWRDALRRTTDNQGRPIFTEGARAPGNTTVDTLFDAPIAWSRGSKTHPTNTGSPTGNDVLFYCNRRYLARGDRSGPETLTDAARAQDDTDDYGIKFRVRRAFQLTHEAAAAVLERITD